MSKISWRYLSGIGFYAEEFGCIFTSVGAGSKIVLDVLSYDCGNF